MSVMSDVYVSVIEGLERGFSPADVAYQLTCEYPALPLEKAIEMVESVDKLEREYLEELTL